MVGFDFQVLFFISGQRDDPTTPVPSPGLWRFSQKRPERLQLHVHDGSRVPFMPFDGNQERLGNGNIAIFKVSGAVNMPAI